jgi:hypothetical protein
MQEIQTITHHNGVRRPLLQPEIYFRDEEWSPRETFFFIVLTSTAGWVAALYPILAK